MNVPGHMKNTYDASKTLFLLLKEIKRVSFLVTILLPFSTFPFYLFLRGENEQTKTKQTSPLQGGEQSEWWKDPSTADATFSLLRSREMSPGIYAHYYKRSKTDNIDLTQHYREWTRIVCSGFACEREQERKGGRKCEKRKDRQKGMKYLFFFKVILILWHLLTHCFVMAVGSSFLFLKKSPKTPPCCLSKAYEFGHKIHF